MILRVAMGDTKMKTWLVLVVAAVSILVGCRNTIAVSPFPPVPTSVPTASATQIPGSKWTLATSSASFSERCWHDSGVFNGEMWVTGGYYCDPFLTVSVFNDVWRSSNGSDWTFAPSAYCVV